MTIFLICATLLILVVLALLLPPLWRSRQASNEGERRKDLNLAIFRSQLIDLEREKSEGNLGEIEYQQSHDELKRRLLDEVTINQEKAPTNMYMPSRKLAIALALALPLLATAGYLMLGNSSALDQAITTQQGNMAPDQIQGMVEKLAQRLKENPENTDGWLMLARSYKSLGRPADAAKAYGKAEAAVFESPDLLTDYADVLAMLSGGNLKGKPMALISKALHLDPTHIVALWLAGTAAYNDKQFADAIIFWERALMALPPGSEDAQTLSDGIAEARKRMGAKSDLKKSVSGRVSIAPSFKDSVSPSDTVFVFARAPDGSRMPIAIAKAHVSDLPFDFVLDDSSAMMADNKISGQMTVLVLARISKSGNAIPKPGDLESEAKSVKLGESKLRIVVDRKY